MPNSELVNYIKDTASKGFNIQQIKDFLIKQGWTSQDIDEAINFMNQESNPYAQTQEQSQNFNQQQNFQQSNNHSQQSTGESKSSEVKGIKRRNPAKVILLYLLTFGIYGIFWLVHTSTELNNNTKSAPKPKDMLLFLIPFANFIFMIIFFLKYSRAINELTGFNDINLFLFFIFLGPVGMIIAQGELNKKADH
jgi:DNA-binding transcriptional MerR regulator